MSGAGHFAADDLLHHLTITAEISSGPGIEIIAAELLLDLVQRLGYEAVVAHEIRLNITTQAQPSSTA